MSYPFHCYGYEGELDHDKAREIIFGDSVPEGVLIHLEEYSEPFSKSEARAMRNLIYTGLSGKYVIVGISAPSISEEAQQVLLKVLEEPPKGVSLILSVDRLESLLETVRSRMRLLIGKKEVGADSWVITFLESTVGDRLDMIVKKNSSNAELIKLSRTILDYSEFAYRKISGTTRLKTFERILLIRKSLEKLTTVSGKRTLDLLAVVLPRVQ